MDIISRMFRHWQLVPDQTGLGSRVGVQGVGFSELKLCGHHRWDVGPSVPSPPLPHGHVEDLDNVPLEESQAGRTSCEGGLFHLLTMLVMNVKSLA